MFIRRVVTGLDSNGHSVFISDGPTPRTISFEATRDHAVAHVWTTPPGPAVTAQLTDPTTHGAGLIPPAGGTSLMIVMFPPAHVMSSDTFDPAAAGAEFLATIPDLARTFELDNPGMHTTDSVDYGIVLSGEIWLELDNGQERKLNPSDVVVQQRTRHAWRNKSDAAAVVAFVMVGAQRT